MSTEQATQQKVGDGSTLAAVLEKKNERIAHSVVERAGLDNSQIRFIVRVPADALAPRTEEVLDEIRRTATIPGFRRGKAPAAMVKAQYGKHAKDDAIRRLTPRLAANVAEDAGLSPLTEPYFEGWKTPEDGGNDAIVTFAIEVRPEIALTPESFNDLAATVVENVVDDARVDREIEGLRARNASFEPSGDDATFEEHDGVLLDCDLYSDAGVYLGPYPKKNHYTQNATGELPVGVAAALVGHKKGDRVEVGGINLPREGMDPLTATARVAIHEVRKRRLPALDAEFAKDIDAKLASVDDLKAFVRKEVVAAEEARERNEALGQVYEELTKRVPFEVPGTLVRQFANNNLGRMEQRLNSFGSSLKRLDKQTFESVAQRAFGDAGVQVRVGLLTEAIGKHFDVTVSDAELEAEIERIAERQGRKPLAIRAALEKEKRVEAFREELRTRLINDKVLSMVAITKKAPEAGAPAPGLLNEGQ